MRLPAPNSSTIKVQVVIHEQETNYAAETFIVGAHWPTLKAPLLIYRGFVRGEETHQRNQGEQTPHLGRVLAFYTNKHGYEK